MPLLYWLGFNLWQLGRDIFLCQMNLKHLKPNSKNQPVI